MISEVSMRFTISQSPTEAWKRDLEWTHVLGVSGDTPVTPEWMAASIAEFNRSREVKLVAALDEVERLDRLNKCNVAEGKRLEAGIELLEAETRREVNRLQGVIDCVRKESKLNRNAAEQHYQRSESERERVEIAEAEAERLRSIYGCSCENVARRAEQAEANLERLLVSVENIIKTYSPTGE